jgi:hypothetical protein
VTQHRIDENLNLIAIGLHEIVRRHDATSNFRLRSAATSQHQPSRRTPT